MWAKPIPDLLFLLCLAGFQTNLLTQAECCLCQTGESYWEQFPNHGY